MQHPSAPRSACWLPGPSSGRECELQCPSVPSRNPPRILDGMSDKTVGKRSGYFDAKIAARRRRDGLRPVHVDRFILAAARTNLPASGIDSFDHHLKSFPDLLRIIDSLNLSLPLKQHLKPAALFVFGD